MKTLIIYGTNHGTTEKCTNYLNAELLGEVSAINIKNYKDEDLSSFDNIIIGGSIYAGKIQKEITAFCNKNIDNIKNKKIGLFICGMMEESIETELNNSFPKILIDNAYIKECFGGEFIFKNMNFAERFIVKAIAKRKNDISTISKEKITKFASVINEI